MIKHLVSTGDLLTWCGLTAARRDELTGRREDMSCKECRNALIHRGICPECGEKKLAWGVSQRKKTNVADGCLSMNDVETVFHLGCNECSETWLFDVDAETVAKFLNFSHWRP